MVSHLITRVTRDLQVEEELIKLLLTLTGILLKKEEI